MTGSQYCLHDALITNKEVQEKYPYILEQSLWLHGHKYSRLKQTYPMPFVW